jgi:homoserine O-acetyltransferase
MNIEINTNQEAGSVGIVETRYYTFDGLILENGETIAPVTLAYETYGKLNADKSNAILLCHALSGDAHVAGYHEGDTKPGWWDDIVGPGKGFDTNKYFVICANILGGCKGSTGPSSVNPKTGRPYALDFPLITISDMVNAERRLVDFLGIEKLLTVAGGSMGGMQVLEWMVAYPERLRSVIAMRHSPQQIAFNEVGRQAIIADANWKNGNYYDGAPPSSGLSVARMVGHITYMSDKSMAEKFGRKLRDNKDVAKFTQDFEVEGYLHHQGTSFVERFDANSYLYITKAIDLFDVARDKTLAEVFKGLSARVLVIAFKSDWLYPPYQTQDIVRACKFAGLDATYCEIESTYGHDAFLLETDEETYLVKHFLERVLNGHTRSEYGN